jgi:Ubiquitin fusion degradation protein UFD1
VPRLRKFVRSHSMDLFLFVLCLACIVAIRANFLSKAWNRAIKQTLYEQEVEDINAVHKIDNHLVRRLIVMPLTDAFNPNQVNGMHGKVQYGDKCSLPGTIGRLIFEKPYEVPWLFEIIPVNMSESKILANDAVGTSSLIDKPSVGTKLLKKAYLSPLDFRSPENYIFLPRWLMVTLGLKANDLVDVSFVRIKLASLVVLQPLTLEWDAMIQKGNRDPQTVLEHEVNKYSSLTAGSTIYIEVDGLELPLLVKETFAEGGVSVKGVRVQDSDIKVDIDRGHLDELIRLQELEAELIAKAEAEDKLLNKRKLSSI